MALDIIISHDKATSASVRLRHRELSMQGIQTQYWHTHMRVRACYEDPGSSSSSKAVEDTAHEDNVAVRCARRAQSPYQPADKRLAIDSWR